LASAAIIQPAIVKSRNQTAANRYVVSGQQKARLAVAPEVRFGFHIEKPITAPTATQNGRPPPLGVPPNELPSTAKPFDQHVERPEDQERRDEVARKHADPREAEQVVEDHHARDDERQREDVAPAVEAVPERDEQIRLKATQPSGAIRTKRQTIIEPALPKTDRVRRP
jgi:hypothetical protein